MARINSWTAKKLSYAGRAQLVKTVLFGVQTYWAQLFIIPAKIIKLIEGLCKSYLWSGVSHVTKKALVAWDKVCCPKYEGGLGLLNIKIWNRAAITKLCWDLENKADKLWIKWIHAYYIKGQREWRMSNNASWMVKKIMNAKILVDQVQQLPSRRKGVLRQIYYHLKEMKQRLAWTCLMYRNAARPKAYIIIWIMMHQKLSTVDKVVQWGIEEGKECVLCKNAEKSAEHLFLHYQYARKVWKRILESIGQHSTVPLVWEQFQNWCIQNGKGKRATTQRFKTVLTEGIYRLWIERNNRIFENKSKKEENIAKEIVCVTMARISFKNSKM
ncbi:uncharacterized protein [Solanum lycopersicum]|uniref:uncharacterized protein n=1 Tax=Solanum lycopersicum TaxID=4081 RepID=UPI003747A9C1